MKALSSKETAKVKTELLGYLQDMMGKKSTSRFKPKEEPKAEEEEDGGVTITATGDAAEELHNRLKRVLGNKGE